MSLRDSLERLVWTVVAAAGGGLIGGPLLSVSVWQAAGVAGLAAGVNFLTILARDNLSILPAPGGGLPGLTIKPKKATSVRKAVKKDAGAIDTGALVWLIVGFLLGVLAVKAGVIH